jgi:hypothetical protein
VVSLKTPLEIYRNYYRNAAELENTMIKMQIVMDDDRIRDQKQFDIDKIHRSLDAFLIDKLGLKKSNDGLYLGRGDGKDFSYFGLAFNTLRKKDWFLDNVKTWLYFNSDASDDPNDFVVEDFKAFCAGMLALKDAREAMRGVAENLGIKDEQDVVNMVKEVRKERRKTSLNGKNIL